MPKVSLQHNEIQLRMHLAMTTFNLYGHLHDDASGYLSRLRAEDY